LAGTAFVTAAGTLTLGGTLIVAAAGAVASTVAGMLIKPSLPSSAIDLNAGGGARTFQFRQPTPPRDVVLGRVKKSGPMIFIHSAPDDTGRADGYLYLQIAVAGHPCAYIGETYLNDELSTEGKFVGLVRVGKNLGSVDQVEDADFLAELGGIFAGHRGRGIANLAARLKGNAQAFPSGLPNLSAVVWGVSEVYDPRNGRVGWTNNAILCYVWWKTWTNGMRVEWEDIDLDTLIDSANVCDQRIPVSGNQVVTPDSTNNVLLLASGARAIDVGDGVRFETSDALPGGIVAGVTYYAIPDQGGIQLATTVINALDRIAIDITNDGSGTLTLFYVDEARWKVNGTVTLDMDKSSIRDQLLTSFMGFDVEIGGKWFIHAAAPTLPTRTLDEDDLAGPLITRPKRSIRDKFNGVRARFINPSANWQPADAPPYQNADYVAVDNGRPLWEDVEFPFTTSVTQVQRSMKLHLERNRRENTVSLTAMFTAIPLRPQKGVYLSFQRYGWEQKQHLITGWTWQPDFNVALTLEEDDPAIHDWTVDDEMAMSEPQDVTLPDPSSIGTPSTITIATPAGLSYAHIDVTATKVLSLWLAGYDFEYRNAGGSTWTSYGRVVSPEGVDPTISVERASAQDFRVRAVTRNGSPGTFLTNLAPGAPTEFTSSGAELQWTNGSGATQVQVFVGADAATATLAETLTVTPGAQTREVSNGTYWLRSRNAQGNVSIHVGPVEVSV
jgi:hypothetical protein